MACRSRALRRLQNRSLMNISKLQRLKSYRWKFSRSCLPPCISSRLHRNISTFYTVLFASRDSALGNRWTFSPASPPAFVSECCMSAKTRTAFGTNLDVIKSSRGNGFPRGLHYNITAPYGHVIYYGIFKMTNTLNL